MKTSLKIHEKRSLSSGSLATLATTADSAKPLEIDILTVLQR